MSARTRIMKKIVTIEQAVSHTCGEVVALTNGCFDLLHPGHILALSKMRLPGFPVVVLLNSDASVAALKPGRPIVNMNQRAVMLAALEFVDWVVVFDGPDCADEIRQFPKCIYYKGEEYQNNQNPAEAQALADITATIMWQPRVGHWSTSSLIARCAKAYMAEEGI